MKESNEKEIILSIERLKIDAEYWLHVGFWSFVNESEHKIKVLEKRLKLLKIKEIIK